MKMVTITWTVWDMSQLTTRTRTPETKSEWSVHLMWLNQVSSLTMT